MRSPGATILLVAAVGVLVGLGAYTLWYSRAYAYLSDDPAACANCHIMNDSHASWGASSHRGVTCNDCHLPHDLVGKYLAKAEDGFRHSRAFTFEKVQVLRASERAVRDIQHNCMRCHESAMDSIMSQSEGASPACTRCHRRVGHVL